MSARGEQLCARCGLALVAKQRAGCNSVSYVLHLLRVGQWTLQKMSAAPDGVLLGVARDLAPENRDCEQ